MAGFDPEQRIGGFKETAEYFEGRARRRRDDANNERHLNAARFYRELAAITPGVPAGYVPPKNVNRAHRYRNRAEECRTISALLTDANCKRRMAELATTYDNLAEIYEKPSGLAASMVIPRSGLPEGRPGTLAGASHIGERERGGMMRVRERGNVS